MKYANSLNYYHRIRLKLKKYIDPVQPSGNYTLHCITLTFNLKNIYKLT